MSNTKSLINIVWPEPRHEWEHIGNLAVDTAQVVIADPIYAQEAVAHSRITSMTRVPQPGRRGYCRQGIYRIW